MAGVDPSGAIVDERLQMTRKWLPFIAILVVVLLVAGLIMLLQPRQPSLAPSAGLPEANALDPVREEMECVDQVLANHAMKSEDVQPALDRCRSRGASETTLVNSQ